MWSEVVDFITHPVSYPVGRVLHFIADTVEEATPVLAKLAELAKEERTEIAGKGRAIAREAAKAAVETSGFLVLLAIGTGVCLVEELKERCDRLDRLSWFVFPPRNWDD